jgi:ATP-dependent protease ClpP protease subunit
MYTSNYNAGGNTATAVEKDYSLFVTDNLEVFFTGPITTESMAELVRELKSLETTIVDLYEETKKTLDGKHKKYFDHVVAMKPVRLTIHSTGGLVYAALFAVDIIKSLKIPVHTVVCGYCASAATLLFLSGSQRFITKNSTMMIHEIRSGCWGKKTYLDDQYENYNKLSAQLIQYYKDNTKLTEDDLIDILKRDINWTPEECLEKGLVDEIV